MTQSTKQKNNVVKLPQKKPVAAAVADTLTDVGNAERFAAKFSGSLCYVPQRGQWLEFADHCWHVDEKRNVVNHTINLTKEMLLEASTMLVSAYRMTDKVARDALVAEAYRLTKHSVQSQSKQKIEALIGLAQAQPNIAKSQAAFDQDDLIFGVQNGVLELKNGIFRDGKPADLISRQSNAQWLGGDEEIGCPLFESFLKEMQPDPNVRHWLQKFCGYLLTGRTDEQIFVVMQGRGANGKSVFVEILKKVLGKYARTVQFDTFMERNNSTIRNDLAALDKVRLVVAQEGPESARLDEGIMKQLTGGDQISARFLHREFFEFWPKFTVILVTNHKPVITGTDEGIWRRLVLVPWHVSVPEERRDKQLINKLESELPGILAWCVKGYHLWREQGLSNLPSPLVSANSEYRADSDLIGLWLTDCCEIVNHAISSNSDIYSSYENWARSGGFRPISQKTLGDKLVEKGFSRCKSGGSRRWVGFRVKKN